MANDSTRISTMPRNGLERIGPMPTTMQWPSPARFPIPRIPTSTAASNISSKHAGISFEVNKICCQCTKKNKIIIVIIISHENSLKICFSFLLNVFILLHADYYYWIVIDKLELFVLHHHQRIVHMQEHY